MLETLKQADTNLFLFLNGLHSPFFDVLMFQVSLPLFWIPFYLLLIVLLFRKYRWQAMWILLFVAVLITATDQGAVHLFKNVFLRLRPSQEPALQGTIHLVNGYKGGIYGFISNHAANTFALAVFLAIVVNDLFRGFVPLMIFWAFLLSYSRIYLGVHYPGDILAGIIFGTVLALIFAWIFKKFVPLKKKYNQNPLL